MTAQKGKSVLVAGASGFVGGAIIERFVADGWRVVGLSRRAPLAPVAGAEFATLDLLDAASCRKVAEQYKDVKHLVYAAVNETMEEIGGGWAGSAYIERNALMFSNLLDPLLGRDGALEHVMIMHGTKAYAPFRAGHLPVPLRESMPRPDFDDFYFRQEDYIAAKASDKLSWTVFRPQIIAGGGMGSNLNVLLAVSVFASLRRAAGQDLPLPSTGPYGVLEMTDVELLASAVAWSAGNPAARNQAFNVANGDVFVWPDLWPVIAEEIGLPVGAADDTLSIRAEVEANAGAWAELVRRHNLPVPADPNAYLGGSTALAGVALGGSRNTVTSTIKLRQAGFPDCIDTAACVVKWIRRWRDNGMLPPK